MPDYRDFDRLECLTRISGTFISKTPLRVGAGREPPLESSVDLAVLRINGKPCIPGSSLKGVMRSIAEALAKSKGWEVHPPWELPEKEKKDGYCHICGIFGNTELAGHIRVHDAFPQEFGRVFIKPGVAIDRDFGSVRAGPFHEEFVEPGTKWNFQMDIINIRIFPNPGDERGQLLRSLLQIFKEQGLQVGARKTIGAGLITLEEAKWKIYKLENGELKIKEFGEI